MCLQWYWIGLNRESKCCHNYNLSKCNIQIAGAAIFCYNLNPPLCFVYFPVRHGASGRSMARGWASRAFGPRCCPKVGVRRFLSTRAPGVPEPVQKERESEDHLHTHQTQGDIAGTHQNTHLYTHTDTYTHTNTFRQNIMQYNLGLLNGLLKDCSCALKRKLLL